MPDYVASRYYPARIGEIFKDQYQIVGKLGFGASSTNHSCRRYVTLKIFIKSASMGQQLDVQTHGERLKDSSRSQSSPVLAFVLKRLFLALDYLHTECQIIHADIKAGNIMFGIADDSVFSDFKENELRNPCPRKDLDGRIIYVSRELRMPREWGAPALCDFGSAMPGGIEHLEDIQPNIYRAPEVILEVPWTYSVDVWNVGCMIWNIFEGESLFTGHDPEFQTYRSRAHLAEIIRLLGPPPPSLLARGMLSHKLRA
ncbi:CMGC/SRPK protein kinase [Elaphomyces granulatus]